jgi:predicted ribosomally synthesized peptide with SipW-like signal peptide
VGAGTFAAFSDTESSNSNSITAGTLELDSTVASETNLGNGVPGDEFNSTTEFTYDSGSNVENVVVDLKAALAEPSDEPSEDNNNISAEAFAKNLNITSAELKVLDDDDTELATDDLLDSDSTSSPVNSGINASNGNSNSYTDMLELANAISGGEYGNWNEEYISDLSPGQTIEVSITGKIHESTGNEAQADGVSLTLSARAEQPTNN